MGVRVRWQQSEGSVEDVKGYKVHMRFAGDVYDKGVDVGMPKADDNGILSAVVKRVDGNQDYAFAVTAYGHGSTESPISNEAVLRAASTLRPVCAELRCDSSGCSPVTSPDGLGCFSDDPCAVGVCAGGNCAVSSDAPVPLELEVANFKIAPAAKKRKQLTARARMPIGAAVGEPFEDATFEVRDASSGVLFYQASVSAESFGLKRKQGSYVYPSKRRHRAPAGANGLKHVGVWVGDGGGEVSVKATSLDLARLASNESLTWVIRLGNRCVRAPEVACGKMRRGQMRCA